MKRQSLKLLSLLSVLCFSIALVSCEEEIPEIDLGSYDASIEVDESDELATDGIQYTYEEETNSYAVSGYIGYSDVVYIPSVWNGLPVTKINKYAFYENDFDFDTIIIPSSVYYLEQYAFRSINVDRIIINSTNIYVTSYAFEYCSSMTIIMNGSYARIDGEAICFSSGSHICNLVLPLNFDFNKSSYEICSFPSNSSSCEFCIYYMGTREYLDENPALADYLDGYTKYYYSEEEPQNLITRSLYWHFDEDGYPVNWIYSYNIL